MCVCTLHSAICVSAYDPLMHMHTGMTPAHTHTTLYMLHNVLHYCTVLYLLLMHTVTFSSLYVCT